MFNGLHNQRGSASVELLVLLPFLFFFLTLAPDFLRLGAVFLSGHNVAEKTMTLMELQGGMNEQVAQDLLSFMREAKLRPEQWQVQTDDIQVPYGEPMELTLRTKVPLIAFRWVGMNIELPIEITKVGISRQAGPNT